ncbi:DUF692 domain-containing protein [Spartinivicinus poritis]|uniref:DUF692 domain-containing protein n=1 Tax=Spartinivicinus poritis TaxID=2994640 RepID=A0ABT5UH78_9GAMM|nr:DUF692 domain-containing protein [Spartinivicinus sp. A2-2]MDE1465753.1 DUF692 domain-containing protein [Spartinivicinus sp. A2-2]
MWTHTLTDAGIGLRSPHLQAIIRDKPVIPWLEVHICNFLGGGLNRMLLHKIRENYPLSFHGVNLNLGGVDPLNQAYLLKLRQAVDEFQPALVSEHVCFTSLQGHHFHDLLPIPYTATALQLMAERIDQVQTLLSRPILIENVSRYIHYPESEMSEAEFIAALCKETGCGILLDINNAYVNQQNLGIDVNEFLNSIPMDHVGEIHLAGFSETDDGWLIDTHGSQISEPVWQHYRQLCKNYPAIPCLIERDNNLPPLAELLQEQAQAQRIINQYKRKDTSNVYAARY